MSSALPTRSSRRSARPLRPTRRGFARLRASPTAQRRSAATPRPASARSWPDAALVSALACVLACALASGPACALVVDAEASFGHILPPLATRLVHPPRDRPLGRAEDGGGLFVR